MHTCYAGDEIPRSFCSSIFLAGPTPRPGQNQGSWRKEAIEYLEDKGFEGVVFVPEPRSEDWRPEYEGQISWELEALKRSDCIVFWIPRDLDLLPGFTTNDEWGAWKGSGKCVLGVPPGTPKTGYQLWYARELGIPIAESLETTLGQAIERVRDSAPRDGEETLVPLHIWNTPRFQMWRQKGSGTSLEPRAMSVFGAENDETFALK